MRISAFGPSSSLLNLSPCCFFCCCYLMYCYFFFFFFLVILCIVIFSFFFSCYLMYCYFFFFFSCYLMYCYFFFFFFLVILCIVIFSCGAFSFLSQHVPAFFLGFIIFAGFKIFCSCVGVCSVLFGVVVFLFSEIDDSFQVDCSCLSVLSVSDHDTQVWVSRCVIFKIFILDGILWLYQTQGLFKIGAHETAVTKFS